MSTIAAGRALIVHRDTPGTNEERLGRILAFLGVPYESLSVADLASRAGSLERDRGYAVFGNVEAVGAVAASSRAAAVLQEAAAIYAYSSGDRAASLHAWSSLAGGVWAWRRPFSGTLPVTVTSHCPELTASMSGIEVDMRLADQDAAVLAADDAPGVMPIVSIDGAPAFLRVDRDGTPTYFCASSGIVDIEAPVDGNYYDVKTHFLSAVPLVMFVTALFRDVMWRPQELGACLIIDDPLLKSRYGFCDFERLRDLMRQRGFTTNVAFIPWNWRRTTRAASEFFRREADVFSVSIHGCDHVAAEFGSASSEALDNKARLAQSRMQAHQDRTGIEHDPVMVFPQGVFSHECAPVLKLNGFVAAVNTEIAPVNDGPTRTTVRDVWDTAILAYSTFPIYTRRYAFHGIENFAFDLLLGKPCFIVAHHEFFRDRGAALTTLVDKLSSLNCTLRWRSPREVIRGAYRRRSGANADHVEMYGSELRLTNDTDREREIRVRKRESDPFLVASVDLDGSRVEPTRTGNAVEFGCRLAPNSEALVSVHYQASGVNSPAAASLKYRVHVAARRLLSELRDEYVTPLLPARNTVSQSVN